MSCSQFLLLPRVQQPVRGMRHCFPGDLFGYGLTQQEQGSIGKTAAENQRTGTGGESVFSPIYRVFPIPLSHRFPETVLPCLSKNAVALMGSHGTRIGHVCHSPVDVLLGIFLFTTYANLLDAGCHEDRRTSGGLETMLQE